VSDADAEFYLRFRPFEFQIFYLYSLGQIKKVVLFMTELKKHENAYYKNIIEKLQ
jgi:hypothetical protein